MAGFHDVAPAATRDRSSGRFTVPSRTAAAFVVR
jgi:hypothetical protein